MGGRRRALVIGGSVGGLFAAHWLRRIGWDASVFERVEEGLESRGAGIGTSEELGEALRRLDLPLEGSIGIQVDSRVCLDRNGRITHEVHVPQQMSAWARIYRRLKDGFPLADYRAGAALERLEQDDSGVTAIFADGSRERGELLIGADGLRSTVRGLLAPQVQPVYAGYLAWRGVAEESAFPPDLHEALFHRYAFCLPEGEMMLAYPIPGRDDDVRAGRRGYNFVWYRPADERGKLAALCTDAEGRCHGTAIAPPLIRRQVVEEMRAEAQALLAPQIARALGLVARPFFQAIFDLIPPRIAWGRIALLGDAAFVARPHVGIGVTKAALDAECLAQVLTDAESDVAAALERYDRERRRFGTRICQRAQALGAYLEAGRSPRLDPPPPDVLMREIGSTAVDIRAMARV